MASKINDNTDQHLLPEMSDLLFSLAIVLSSLDLRCLSGTCLSTRSLSLSPSPEEEKGKTLGGLHIII